MKNKIILFAIFACFAIFANSCDQIDAPYTLNSGVDTNTVDTTKVYRKILIEEFTGHACNNCPKAHDILTNILKKYPNNIISIAHHVGSLAEPTDELPYNFKNSNSDGLNSIYKASAGGLPNGLLNRYLFGNIILQKPENWELLIKDSLLNIVSDVKIELTAMNGSGTDTTEIKATAKLTYLKAQDSANYISFYLIQDSIISGQIDANHNIIPNYVHRHVVRSAMNNTWGQQIGTTEKISKGATFEIPVTYKLTEQNLADTKWKNKNLKVVAFVHKKPTKGEVLQVEEADVVK